RGRRARGPYSRIGADRRDAVAHRGRGRQPRVLHAPRAGIQSLMTIRRVGLLARAHLPAAAGALADAAAWLSTHGGEPITARDRFARDADVVIAFGGDGTLLDAAGAIAAGGADIPVVGVNLGHLGFLTEVSRGELVDTLAAIVEGRTWTETRLLLAGR